MTENIAFNIYYNIYPSLITPIHALIHEIEYLHNYAYYFFNYENVKVKQVKRSINQFFNYLDIIRNTLINYLNTVNFDISNINLQYHFNSVTNPSLNYYPVIKNLICTIESYVHIFFVSNQFVNEFYYVYHYNNILNYIACFLALYLDQSILTFYEK